MTQPTLRCSGRSPWYNSASTDDAEQMDVTAGRLSKTVGVIVADAPERLVQLIDLGAGQEMLGFCMSFTVIVDIRPGGNVRDIEVDAVPRCQSMFAAFVHLINKVKGCRVQRH